MVAQYIHRGEAGAGMCGAESQLRQQPGARAAPPGQEAQARQLSQQLARERTCKRGVTLPLAHLDVGEDIWPQLGPAKPSPLH